MKKLRKLLRRAKTQLEYDHIFAHAGRAKRPVNIERNIPKRPEN